MFARIKNELTSLYLRWNAVHVVVCHEMPSQNVRPQQPFNGNWPILILYLAFLYTIACRYRIEHALQEIHYDVLKIAVQGLM